MIQADPIQVQKVLEEVRSLETVTEAHKVKGAFNGAFNIVALIEADGLTDLPPLLSRATFTIPGVYATAAVVITPPPRH